MVHPVQRIISGNNIITTMSQTDSVATHHHAASDVDGLPTVIQTVETLENTAPGNDDVIFVQEEW